MREPGEREQVGILTTAILVDSSPRCAECNSLEIDHQFLKVSRDGSASSTGNGLILGLRHQSLYGVQKKAAGEILASHKNRMQRGEPVVPTST